MLLKVVVCIDLTSHIIKVYLTLKNFYQLMIPFYLVRNITPAAYDEQNTPRLMKKKKHKRKVSEFWNRLLLSQQRSQSSYLQNLTRGQHNLSEPRHKVQILKFISRPRNYGSKMDVSQ
ncbi:hypothetical protein P8452_32552 [Trifolium repens]|nr:hypothetical protein P8452_32552 [Trifolium repens]